MKKPGFWRVFGAYVIDSVILLVFNFTWLWMWMFAASMGLVGKLPDWLMMFGLLGWIIVDVIYFALLEQKGDVSLGKRIFKLKIQPLDVPFWKVFVSYSIDCAVFILIGGCIYFYLKHNLISHLSAAELAHPKVGIRVSAILLRNLFFLSVGGMISTPFYFSILESLFGKTLGKKLMGLQVVQDVQDVPKQKGE